MDEKGKVRTLTWRQENLTINQICRRTKRSRSYVIALLAAARDQPQDAITAIKSQSGRLPKISNTLMM